MPALNPLATKKYDENTTYDELVRFVHLFVVEPHPESPDPSPYTGVVWEMSYSTKGQAFTYDERVATAQEIDPLLKGNQLLLVDDLVPGALNNPVWCTYKSLPELSGRMALLIPPRSGLEPIIWKQRLMCFSEEIS